MLAFEAGRKHKIRVNTISAGIWPSYKSSLLLFHEHARFIANWLQELFFILDLEHVMTLLYKAFANFHDDIKDISRPVMH